MGNADLHGSPAERSIGRDASERRGSSLIQAAREAASVRNHKAKESICVATPWAGGQGAFGYESPRF